MICTLGGFSTALDLSENDLGVHIDDLQGLDGVEDKGNHSGIFFPIELHRIIRNMIKCIIPRLAIYFKRQPRK